jgi:hypothetical protein
MAKTYLTIELTELHTGWLLDLPARNHNSVEVPALTKGFCVEVLIAIVKIFIVLAPVESLRPEFVIKGEGLVPNVNLLVKLLRVRHLISFFSAKKQKNKSSFAPRHSA